MSNELNALDASLVTVGKPTEGGCGYTSFAANAVPPTDATTAMSTLTDFVSLGELSENGFTESRDVQTTDHKGWHGKVLLTSIDGETNKFKAEFVEVNRPAVAKLRYGAGAVAEGSDKTVSKIEYKAFDGKAVPLVFDELESGGHLRRTVVKKAVVTSFDDVPHQRGSLMVYGMEFTANEPDDGTAPVVVYRAKPAAGGGGS